eukprot:TRINITY_DN9549_c0_g1_i1.p2 TRINITY_DN9549_c0_g1~~TRINITY_DN9549_c0_g1_i1.p2  ORF type:complete len:353 (-),score=20.46 TRINITY_DN9549_c0_g1_i1:1428-2486(-)
MTMQEMAKEKPQELWLAEYTLQWLADLKVGKRILVAVDDSFISQQALLWVLTYVAKPHDQVQVVTVAPLLPNATVDRNGLYDGYSITTVLQRAIAPLKKGGFNQNNIQTHVLTAMGGTSGIGNVIVNFGRISKADMIVVGSRGVNLGLKYSLMSVMGLGSVSKHCIHTSEIPVLVIHQNLNPNCYKIKQNMLHVCVSIDGGQKSYEALEWTCQNFIQDSNRQVMLHIVSVQIPIPRFEHDQTDTWGDEKCNRAREIAHMNGISNKQIYIQVLNMSSQGSNQIGESICQYVKSNCVDLIVLGARNMSSLQRSVLKIVGLGSVSDYCVQNLICPVLVYKSQRDVITIDIEDQNT